MQIFGRRFLGAIVLCFFLGAIPALATVLPGSCGKDGVTFAVKTQKNQPAPAPPPAGKARIVFVENLEHNSGLCIKCKVTARVGVDGAWVGADYGDSHFSYTVDPGEHHLCADWQSALGRLRQRKVGLASFNAEAGEVYYYEIKVRDLQYKTTDEMTLELKPLDPDEGKYLTRITALATAAQKK